MKTRDDGRSKEGILVVLYRLRFGSYRHLSRHRGRQELEDGLFYRLWDSLLKMIGVWLMILSSQRIPLAERQLLCHSHPRMCPTHING
jgi:hypothetical protein